MSSAANFAQQFYRSLTVLDVASELDEELLGGEIDPMEVENDDDIDIIPLEGNVIGRRTL